MRTRNIYLVVIILVALIVIGVGVGLYVQAGRAITSFEESRPLPGAVLYDQEGQVIKRLGTGSVYVPLDKTPQDLQNAVKTTKEPRDISSSLAAQIIKPEGTWARLQLAILPSVLERRYSERERLEMYLNQTYFGENAVGVEAASQTYFSKSVQELDLAESALLAALAQEPEHASPFRNPNRATEMRNSVLGQMRSAGHINTEQQQEAEATPLSLERREPGYAHHFSDYLGEQLVNALGEERVFQGGLRVTTTLDRDLQKKAEQIIQERNLDGALVALNPRDGKILAMVGGINYLEDATNLATTKQQETGNTLRPLIYATGLKAGWAMNHLVEDVQRKFGELQVDNTNDRYWGPVTMKHALVMDLNNASIWTLNELGIERFTDFARSVELNIEQVDQNLTLALGQVKEGLSLLELTAAYLPAVNEGKFSPPSGFEQVNDAENHVVLSQETQKPAQILSKEQAYLLTNMLIPTTDYGSISELDVEFPAALHASVAQDGKSQWAIGYTPTLLVGVFVKTPEGNEEDQQTQIESLAGEIWLEFMTSVLDSENTENKERENNEFEVPDNVETDVMIDVFTGLLANELCAQVELDAFIEGTKPTQWAPCSIPPPPPTPPTPRREAAPIIPVPTPEAAPQPQPEPEPEPEPEVPIEPETPGEETPPQETPAEPEPEVPIEPVEPTEPTEPVEPETPQPPPSEEPIQPEPQPETEPETEPLG